MMEEENSAPASSPRTTNNNNSNNLDSHQKKTGTTATTTGGNSINNSSLCRINRRMMQLDPFGYSPFHPLVVMPLGVQEVAELPEVLRNSKTNRLRRNVPFVDIADTKKMFARENTFDDMLMTLSKKYLKKLRVQQQQKSSLDSHKSVALNTRIVKVCRFLVQDEKDLSH